MRADSLLKNLTKSYLNLLIHSNRSKFLFFIQGMEAFLHAKLMERRIRLSEANNSLIQSTIPGSLAGKLTVPTPVLPKCSFNITSSMKCGDICIPMTKFCQKHIMNDPNQVLFRPCGTVIHSEEEPQNEDGPCETPIPDVFDSSSFYPHT